MPFYKNFVRPRENTVNEYDETLLEWINVMQMLRFLYTEVGVGGATKGCSQVGVLLWIMLIDTLLWELQYLPIYDQAYALGTMCGNI